MIKIFLTGYPGIGKTTAIQKINNYLKLRGLKTGGFITIEERDTRRRIGFKIIDISNLNSEWMAHVSLFEGPKIGKYNVNIDAIDKIGVNAILYALKEADVVLIDEVGPMEMLSRKFRDTLNLVMKSDKPAVLTLHRSYTNKKLPELETDKEVITLQISRSNRDAIPLVASTEILKWI
jgi:nucleoside-triphosphatase